MSARPAENPERVASEVPVPVLMYHSIATGATRTGPAQAPAAAPALADAA